MSFILMQQEADALLAMEKHYSGAERFTYPSLGGVLRIPLHSVAMREEFNLDITRGRIELKKNTFQLRAHRAIVLARIDIVEVHHTGIQMERKCHARIFMFIEKVTGINGQFHYRTSFQTVRIPGKFCMSLWIIAW